MVSYGVKVDGGKTEFSYFTHIEFSKLLREGMGKAKLLVGFNTKFDLHWARRLGVLPPEGVRVWDCQIAEFLIRGQQGSYPSLNEALTRFKLPLKDDKIAEYWKLGIDTQDVPVEELKLYNVMDVDLTYELYLKQQEFMSDKLKKLCMVMGLDTLVLEEMEWNGIKLNVEECKAQAVQTRLQLESLTAEIYSALGVDATINLDSGHQLSCLLFGGAFETAVPERVETLTYKSGIKKGQSYERTFWKTEVIERDPLFTPLKGSETKLVSKAAGREHPVYATGEDVLKQLRKPTKLHRRVIELLLQRAEKEKLLSTYYGALPALLDTMEWGEYLHGNLNQCVARTGRLSSSAPNMQNFSGEVDKLLVTRFAS